MAFHNSLENQNVLKLFEAWKTDEKYFSSSEYFRELQNLVNYIEEYANQLAFLTFLIFNYLSYPKSLTILLAQRILKCKLIFVPFFTFQVSCSPVEFKMYNKKVSELTTYPSRCGCCILGI